MAIFTIEGCSITETKRDIASYDHYFTNNKTINIDHEYKQKNNASQHTHAKKCRSLETCVHISRQNYLHFPHGPRSSDALGGEDVAGAANDTNA